MKTLIKLLVLISLSSCGSQKLITNADELKDYSYFIYGELNNGDITQGTGFLYKKHGKIYLISAAHVLNGWDRKENAPPQPDILFLRVYDKENTARFLPFSVAKLKQHAVKLNKGDADILAVCISIPSSYKIYSLNALINKFEIPPTYPTLTKIVGYPVVDEENNKERYIRLPPIIADCKLIAPTPYSANLIWMPGHIVDGSALNLQNDDHKVKHGNSGSPAYFIINDTFIFGGIAVSYDSVAHTVILLRPEVVKSFINSL